MIDFILIILPLIAVGITIVLLINSVKSKNEKRNSFENQKSDENGQIIEKDYMALGMSLGMCFGVAIGLIFMKTFSINAISYCISFGMLGGMLIGMTIKKK